jgi:hypothetical protein
MENAGMENGQWKTDAGDDRHSFLIDASHVAT